MEKLSQIIQEKHDLDYSQEISAIIILEELFIKKLKANKLYKADRELLIELIQIIKLGEH